MLILYVFCLMGLFVNRKNLIISAMCIELIYLAINFEFVLNSAVFCELHGQIIGVFIMTITASETACALALMCGLN